jgi:hypothetical protein
VICIYCCVMRFKMTGVKRRQVAHSPSETDRLNPDEKTSEPPGYDEKN